VIGHVKVWIDGELHAEGPNLLMAAGKVALARRNVGVGIIANFFNFDIGLGDSNEAVNETQIVMPGTTYGVGANDWDSTAVVPSDGFHFLQWDFNLTDYQLADRPQIASFGIRFGAPLAGFLFARFLSTPFELSPGMTLDISWRLSLVEDLTDG